MYDGCSMNDKDYVTNDTFQTAVFMSRGHSVREMDSSEPRIKFIFDRTEQFEQDLADYLSGNLMVEPNILKSNMDRLYANIYNLRPKK